MAGARPERALDVAPVAEGCRGRFMAMGSPCEVLCESQNASESRKAIALAAGEAWRVEDKFSRYLDGNVVDRINTADGCEVEVDEETARLVEFATQLYELSDRGFDITSGVLRRAWTFDGSDRLPRRQVVRELLELVGWDKVSWTGSSLRMRAGMQIDFGGIGKEYAVDRAAALLRGQADMPCLVNFGGDLAVTGAPSKRPAWRVGVESLQGDDETSATVINLQSGALATSGDARRFIASGGRRYGHIINPRTGWPVADAPRAVTVAAETCVQAGMLSTLAMLEGPGAEQFLDAQGYRYWCRR
jgi:thiamine biosynthesis lipoprotein